MAAYRLAADRPLSYRYVLRPVDVPPGAPRREPPATLSTARP
jgi:hypothetical protein